MEEIPILKDISIIFALSMGVLLLCNRLHIPTVVGFLITGILCGPHSLGLIGEVAEVKTLADVGIILLLFIVGMEFSLSRLVDYKRFFLLGGLLQVLITGAVAFLVAQIIGRPTGESLFLGCLIALSSTAIVMRVLEDRGEAQTAQGKVALSILIFQDLLVVPMVLFTPVLAGLETDFNINFSMAVIKGAATLLLVFILAEFVVPKLLFYIAMTRSRELFLLGVLAICTSVIWMTSMLGISLSLGAFLAGLIISESDYCHEAIGDVLPFQDLFTSFFFVSMGMLLDVNFLVGNIFVVLVLTLAISLLKSSVVGLVTLVLGMPLRIAIMAGLALSQVGEFSFVLIKVGISYGIATDYHHQLFLAVSLMTMAATPLLIAQSSSVADWILSFPLFSVLKKGYSPLKAKDEQHITDHLIIIGYGFVGRSLALAAEEQHIPYRIVDIQPEKVQSEKKKGVPIIFGDAVHGSVLKHANIKEAKAVAITIIDRTATMRVIKTVRQLHPTIHLIARAATLPQAKLFYRLGANEVISDELGSAIELYSHALHKWHIDVEHIAKFTEQLRLENAEVVKLLYKEPSIVQELLHKYPHLDTGTIKVQPESKFAGSAVKDLSILKNLGLTILMIKRGDRIITYPNLDETLRPDDLLVLMGRAKHLIEVTEIFSNLGGA